MRDYAKLSLEDMYRVKEGSYLESLHCLRLGQRNYVALGSHTHND